MGNIQIHYGVLYLAEIFLSKHRVRHFLGIIERNQTQTPSVFITVCRCQRVKTKNTTIEDLKIQDEQIDIQISDQIITQKLCVSWKQSSETLVYF